MGDMFPIAHADSHRMAASSFPQGPSTRVSTTAAVPDRPRGLLAALRRHPGQTLLGLTCIVLFLLAGKLLWPQLRAIYHARAAQKAIDRWEFDEASQHLAVCLTVWKDSASTRFLAARTARRAGHLDEAEEHLRRYQREQGTSKQTTLEWSLLRVQRGEVADVEGQLRASVGPDDPDAPIVLEALVRGYLMTDRLTDLLQAADLWLQVRPNDTHALYWRGLGWDRLGNRAEALAAYRAAVAADPDNTEARLHLGELLLAQADNPGEALSQFEYVRSRRPTDANAGLGCARCQVLLGQPEAARELLDALLAEHPDFSRAWWSAASWRWRQAIQRERKRPCAVPSPWPRTIASPCTTSSRPCASWIGGRKPT